MYFLAIVSRDDLLCGNIVPSYILCQSHGGSESRSPWRVYRANTVLANCPKVLVRSIAGNEIMIDFLSAYRTRDHMHGSKRYRHKSTKKYYPEGALFWFECNIYGEPTGRSIFIKRIPDKTIKGEDGGFTRLKEHLEQKPTTKDLLTSDPLMVDMEFSHIKPRAYQPSQAYNND